MSAKNTVFGLKGNIVYSKTPMQLEICENGYLVCEEGKVKVCIRLCRILTPGFQSKITETGF